MNDPMRKNITVSIRLVSTSEPGAARTWLLALFYEPVTPEQVGGGESAQPAV